MGEQPAEPVRDWRDEATYEPLKQLDRREFAWEYLRRNTRFRRQRRSRPPLVEDRGSVTLLRAEDMDLERWGLLFRRRQLHLRSCRENLLA